MSYDKTDVSRRMSGAVNSLKDDYLGLRTGRASTAMLDPVLVDAYGSKMPLNQLSSISAPESRLLLIQVWDQTMVLQVEKSIRESDLGLNPQTEGNSIRVPIPELSEERRLEIVKVAGKYAEQSKVAIRNIRRDAVESVRKSEKDKEISEDEKRSFEIEIQKLTDDFISEIDSLLAQKEIDIKTL